MNIDPAIMKCFCSWGMSVYPLILGQVLLDALMEPPLPGDPSCRTFMAVGAACCMAGWEGWGSGEGHSCRVQGKACWGKARQDGLGLGMQHLSSGGEAETLGRTCQGQVQSTGKGGGHRWLQGMAGEEARGHGTEG